MPASKNLHKRRHPNEKQASNRSDLLAQNHLVVASRYLRHSRFALYRLRSKRSSTYGAAPVGVPAFNSWETAVTS